MTPSEIIKQNVNATGKNPDVVLQWAATLVKKKQALLLQHGDSVLLLNRIAPGEAELHLFTLDKPMALMEALKDFVSRVRASDLKAVYGKADNPQIVQALKTVGVQVKDSDKPKYNWMALTKE